jgi:hypothetical protein
MYIKVKELMGGCNCKNNFLRRARVILNGRKWEDLNDIEQGQITAFYHDQFRQYGSDEEIIRWLKTN